MAAISSLLVLRLTPLAAALALSLAARPAAAQSAAPPLDSVTVRVVNTDLRSAVQLMGQYLDRPVIFAAAPGQSPMVTLETPRPVARRDVVRLLRGLLESQNYELVADSAAMAYRARPKEQPRPAGPAYQPAPQPGAPRAQVSGPELFVISLKHARAGDVASTVNALFGRAAAGSATRESASRSPTIADELRGNLVPPAGAPLPEAIAGTAGKIASLTGDVTIVPDSRANSLLVRANRADFALISAAVAQVDVRPLQVLIEVLIVESRLDHSFAYGVDASIGAQHVKGTENTTVDGGFTSGQSNAAGLSGFTLDVMGAGGFDLNARITAAEGRGEARILSRPVVLTANNERAEVVVGSQRPFVQVSRSLPTDSPLQDRVVQYKDVGTKLSVTPTISGDGLVQLDVSQEVSNATNETAFNAPVISNRSVKTQLLVRDGQTVVLGGLRDRERALTKGGVPILSSNPLIGGLFGHYSRQTTETELFVFITPRVIRTDADAAAASDSLRARAEKVRP